MSMLPYDIHRRLEKPSPAVYFIHGEQWKYTHSGKIYTIVQKVITEDGGVWQEGVLYWRRNLGLTEYYVRSVQSFLKSFTKV